MGGCEYCIYYAAILMRSLSNPVLMCPYRSILLLVYYLMGKEHLSKVRTKLFVGERGTRMINPGKNHVNTVNVISV